MSRARFIIAVGAGFSLLLLLSWQLHRERRIAACLDNGGTWTGSGCGPLKLRPILQRDLRRL